MKKKLLCALTIIGSIALVGCNNLPDELNSLLSQSGSSEDVSLVTSDSEENTSTSDSEVNSSASEDDNSSDDETSSDSVNNPVSSDSEDNDSEDNPNVSSEGTTTSSDDPITPSEDTSSTPSTSEGTYPTPTPGLEYALNEDGQTAVCMGMGTVDDGVVKDIVIAPTYQNKPVIEIAPMDEIAEKYVFAWADIDSLIMPDSITTIGSEAFTYSSIKHITFSNQLEIIDDYAFSYCENLLNFTLPSSLRTIGASCFDTCISLTEVNIPNGVIEIGECAFMDNSLWDDVSEASQLSKITIPDSVKDIWDSAFCNLANLKNITFGGGCKDLPESALSCCYSLQHLVLPEGFTKIHRNALFDCIALETLELPHSLTQIEDGTFYSYGANVFKEIIYHGTQDEWEALMDKSDGWEDIGHEFTVQFENGDTITQS